MLTTNPTEKSIFDVELPDGIDFLETAAVLLLLGISESTLRRDTRELRKHLSKREFDRIKREEGYSAQSIKALIAFRRLLASKMSRKRAIETLKISGV